MKITIDRIENNMLAAELPDGRTLTVPLLLFPDAAEGDVYIIEKDSHETSSRRKRIDDKMNRLFHD